MLEISAGISRILVLKSDAVMFWSMQLINFNKVSHGAINASQLQAILLSDDVAVWDHMS